MTKQKASKEDKVLRGIERILERMDTEFSSIRNDLTEVKGEMKSMKMEVMENGVNIKSLKVGQEQIDHKIDIAVTNHEGRIRRLEEKAGV